MKFLKFLFVVIGFSTFFFSCTKTDSAIGISKGSLKVNDTTGNCLPLTMHGNYTAGVPLNSDNYIEVYVNVISAGTFNISTDSVNGMYFSSAKGERFGNTGLDSVYLYSHGKPILPGLTTFTLQYDGTSCTVSVIVGSVAPGAFTLTDTSGNNISSTSVNGAYVTGTALVSSDSVVLKMNVTKAGLLSISSNVVDGISFSGAAVFATTGIQNITLIGNGIPQSSGTYNFTVIDSLSDTSKFSVTVAPFGGTSSAAFTLGGTPGGCSGFSQFGNYIAGVKLATSDSVTTQVTVTRAGSYSVVTNPVNGVVFSGTGMFDSAGVYTITLRGSGTPAAPGTFNYTATSDSSNCIFSITYGQGQAVFTLGGIPGGCTGFTLSGTYETDSVLTLNNTVTMDVNVVTPGSYVISTGSVDGITFTASGIFVTSGSQQVTLTGTGTPVLPGTYNFVTSSPTGNCLFTVNVIPSTAVYTIGSGPYGTCTGFNLYGTYATGTPLTPADSALTQVIVSYPGPYHIISDTTDGMTFSAQGFFTATGSQQLTLTGTGTPTSSGTFTVVVGVPPNFCTFIVKVP